MADQSGKWRNLVLALLAAASHPEVSDDFILMNDDFFVMKPASPPNWHRGTLAENKRHDVYGNGFKETQHVLRRLGFREKAVSYELHTPMRMNKHVLRAAIEEVGPRLPVCLHTRTLYGNLTHAGGTRHKDVKVVSPGKTFDYHSAFLSSSLRAWKGELGKYVRAQFPQMSRYESEPPRGIREVNRDIR